MNPKKIVTIIGARPQFIKASAVSATLAASDRLREVVVHTGQHFDANMSDVFFAELGMERPAYRFDIHGGGHGEMTGRMLSAIEKVLFTEKPDAVLVYGDTNSTLAGSLAAIKLHIPVAHVEAGLRSFNMASPEEINRMLTDRVAQWLFTPTDGAAAELLREGTDPGKIHPVGDVMYDVALHHGARVVKQGGMLAKLGTERGLQPGAYCLATIHRAENTDHLDRLMAIVDALSTFAKEVPVVWPLHPRTRAVLASLGKLDALARSVILVEPLAYLDMVQMEKYAALITTDSGGVQKEAFFHRVPCVTMRDETEWNELVESGWNRLAPPVDAPSVLAALHASLGTAGKAMSPYGRGDAARRIVQRLVADLT
ncbi:MAG: UDP-N-acetylglucosamine 2-epimerase (non-hydrolyzing) [Massilia sp.]|nr:UDP-N-acetylglucosamine 2-epimerase (non-hydrolyzing) [Massilia sp.]